MSENYYLDSCIWLNLFKKEIGGDRRFPYWGIALDFLENVDDKGGVIYVSGIVLKELYFVMGKDFWKAKKFFKENGFVEIIKTSRIDYNLARDFEDKDLARISFYDYLHVAVAKRLNCCFVTRDKDLIEFAKRKIEIGKPENLIH
jgi:predicted nucleic acid-binding protein